MTLSDKQLENLGIEINQMIAKQAEISAEKYRIERELKQAVMGMSHDLRTPLTSIIGYLKLINKKELPREKETEYIGIIQRRADRLQRLIDNFFALATIDADDYPLQFERIRLNALTQEILLSYYDQFNAVDKQPTIDITTEDLIVLIDQTAFKRVVENLLLNAIQHAAGSIVVHLKKHDNLAVLTMKNKIDPAKKTDMSRLFDRFYIADQTRQNGRGLGLSIVQSLVEKTGGLVHAELKADVFSVTCTWKVKGE